MKAIIVGGGIGGLTAALMLHGRGIACEVYEQSETIRELGVGINTLPHAIKELAGLDLLDRLDAAAIRTGELIYANRFGQEIWREPRGLDAGYDVPQFSIHRGRLQGVIHEAVLERIEAPHALARHRRLGGPGDEHAVHHRLQPQRQVDVAARRDPQHVDAEIGRRRDAERHLAQRTRSTAELARVEHERLAGVEAVQRLVLSLERASGRGTDPG